MPYPNDQLLGKSGQHAAIAEFLRRGYNVALPEVDLGDDFLVLDHRPGQPLGRPNSHLQKDFHLSRNKPP